MQSGSFKIIFRQTEEIGDVIDQINTEIDDALSIFDRKSQFASTSGLSTSNFTEANSSSSDDSCETEPIRTKLKDYSFSNH